MAEFPTRPLVKICGVTSIDDARLVAEAGADVVGLILAESVRRISLDAAQSIVAAVRGSVLSALVVRDQSDEYIVSSVEMVKPDFVQVHGSLSAELVQRLHANNLLIVKALAVGSKEFEEFDDSQVDAVLLDGPTPGAGRVHSWEALEQRHFARPMIAAGGLTPENVASTIELLRPQGVDSASGVEASPGCKDPTLVRRFVENARRAFDQ